MPKTIQITIDADWIESLMNRGGDYWDDPKYPTGKEGLDRLDKHEDTLYDYIDDAILDMVERNNQE